MFNIDAQDALNLNPEKQSLCRRTIERYIKLLREDELAQAIMHDVTGELVQLLELDVSKQRLDSTHIESNMAKFGRMKLMATAIRRQCDVVDEKVVVKKHTIAPKQKISRPSPKPNSNQATFVARVECRLPTRESEYFPISNHLK